LGVKALGSVKELGDVVPGDRGNTVFPRLSDKVTVPVIGGNTVIVVN
jgi:hypothetical protein